jgi:hypothetical protein
MSENHMGGNHQQHVPLSMTFEEIRRAWGIEEEMGYDAPFSTFTWKRWEEMQMHTMQSFTRFQRAIEQHQPMLALAVVLELQMMMIEMQTEACTWIGVAEKTM